MKLSEYVGEDVCIKTHDGRWVQGYCHSFVGKLDTEDELYDEIMIETERYPYYSIDESEIESIEILPKPGE